MSDKFGDEDPSYDKIGNMTNLNRGLYDGSVFSYPLMSYNYTTNSNKLSSVLLNGASSRSYLYDNNGSMTQETTQGVTANYSYFRDNLPDLFTKGTSSSKYIYSNANSRIIKFNTITNIKEYYIEDMAVYNSGSTDLFWYVPGSGNEVKFKHHSVITSWELNSNTGATSYTTDPYNIPLTQTSVNAYPDMDYIMNDHLGSTRMIYKLNHTCAGVYQNATIQYMADYYAFGKKVREYINPGTVTEKYQYTGKERDIESGYDYFMARNYHSEIGRFMSVDPRADQRVSLSPYNYCSNNPVNRIDPD